ncbi:hypothetical protein ABZ860_13095 [Microbispora sp. NPDC046973]|uniref:hypothetical protein n=1 Tax=Microbispora sp. NPDC046973 TaxID=3155022 RepID=UPI0033FC50FA
MSDVDLAARRWTGALLTLGGLLPLVAVLNPRTWPVWGADEAESWRLITERHASMTAATWLIWAGVALSIAGVALLARMLGSALAIAALAVFATGASLALVSLTFEATVNLSLTAKHRPQPDWYPVVDLWINGLFTAHSALLAPLALVVLGTGIVRTRLAARWTGWFAIAMAILLWGQFAAFQGALPAPLFLALTAIGLSLFLAARRPATAAEAVGPAKRCMRCFGAISETAPGSRS